MFRRQKLLLGCSIPIALIVFGVALSALNLYTNLLWHGITTQGVITEVGTAICSREYTFNRTGSGQAFSVQGQAFSVQFTARTGQDYNSTFTSCEYGVPSNTSPGSSITIVYLPNDPTEIAPLDGLLSHFQFFLYASILSGLITLILLLFWIRKRSRKASRQGQAERNAYHG